MSDTSFPTITTNDGSAPLQTGAPDKLNYLQNKTGIIAGDLAAQEDGSSNRSIFDRAEDFVTKAPILTGAAVVNSFVNTAAKVGNFFGGDFQKASIEDEFGQESPFTDYYRANTGLIEGAGLLVGSLIPGLAATKALKLATETGAFGETFSAATGLMSATREAAITEASTDAAGNAVGSSLFAGNIIAKSKAIAAGAVDSALQGAVYQTATLATMNASPLLDQNTIGDDVKDVLSASLQFGIFGGIGEGIGALREIKTRLTTADLATKQQEIVGVKGLGNLTPGDRIVGLISQKQETPAPTTRLGQLKAQYADDVYNRNLRQEFNKLVGGDEELGGVFHSFIMDAVQNKDLAGEDLASKLGQLAKIGRAGDESIRTDANDVFYVAPKIDLTDHINTTGIPQLENFSSKIATGDFATSKALTLRNPSIQPIVGHALETSDQSLIALSGVGNIDNPLLKYKNVQDAYSKGVDIFVDANGEVHLNLSKDSALQEVPRPGQGRILTKAERVAYVTTGNLPANSKPLLSSATWLNLKDGSQFGEMPQLVVGDIATPKIVKNTLQVGDDLSYKFGAPEGQEFKPANPLEANAEYVWNALRGIKDGDVIHPEHLPQLEALYNTLSKNPDFLDNADVEFSDGSHLPDNTNDLLEHINQVKQSMMHDLIMDGKNSDEIEKIINAPQSFISNPNDALSADKSIIPYTDHMKPNTIRLAYDIGTTKDNVGNVLRGMQASAYRYQLAIQANTDATANMLNKVIGPEKAADYLSNLKVTKSPGDATLAGAGEGAIFSANSPYGSIGQQFERVGRTFNDLQTVAHAAVMDTLSPALIKLRGSNGPQLAAEWGNFTFARRSTGENYVFLTPELAQKYNLDPNTAVLEGAVKYKTTKGVRTQVDYSPDYMPEGFVKGNFSITSDKGLRTTYQLSPEVAAIERAHSNLLSSRNDLRDNFFKAQGLPGNNYNPDVLYAPPLNTARTPFFAYVREKKGYAMGGGDSNVIVANSEEDLRNKISQLPDHLEAITKDKIAEYKKAAGQYDFNRNFTSLKVKSDLARQGLLTNLAPEVRADNLINDLVDFHKNQTTGLLRDYVQLHNADMFAKLEAMNERFTTTANSQLGRINLPLSKVLAANSPYSTYTNTALGISAKDQYPLWSFAQEKLSAFADTAYNAVQQAFGALRKGIITPEEATKVSQKFGLGNPYGEITDSLLQQRYYGGLANRLPAKNILSKVVGTANAILGSTIIRMDPFQQLVHAVTLPIMASLEHGSATKELGDLLSSKVPGSGETIPSFSRVLYNGIKNFFGPDKEKLEELYSKVGMPRDQIFAYRQMINELTVPATPTDSSTWLQKIKNAGDLAEKLSGTKFVNSFNHFMAADVGRQIGEALGLQGQDLLDHIGTYTNRILGNLTAGQRGAIFHGPVGQAVGLFQAYQFNLMQQVFRNIEEGNYKSLAMAAGLQSTIFGASSLPGFQHLNNLIQQHAGNNTGEDIYSTADKALGKSNADFLLYGALSDLSGIALYSRGDINPRQATIVPVNPLDLPSVAAGIRIYQNISQLVSNVSKGGSVPASALLALEHNGLSRPLGGLAEMIQGYATDSKGNLISNISNSTMGWSDYFSIANFSRLLGARPLDEAIAMRALYDNNAAKAADQIKLNSLGDAVKTQLYSSDYVNPNDVANFAAQYAADGGHIAEFNKWILDLTNKAHTPAADQMFNKLGSNPRAQNAFLQMGGVPIQSYVPQSPQTQDINEGTNQ